MQENESNTAPENTIESSSGSNFLAIFLSGSWIGASEFIRNEFFLKRLWLDHYRSLGLTFPSEMLNNLLWALWSFLLAGVILFLSQRLKRFETLLVTWLLAFAAMWLTVGNLGVLPLTLLWFAIPLSIIEVVFALWICLKIAPGRQPGPQANPQ
jgi:hypothetical protein